MNDKKIQCKKEIRDNVDKEIRVKAQRLKYEFELLKALESNPVVKENKCILKTQCKINEILNSLIKYVNTGNNNVKITPYNSTLVGDLKSNTEIKEFVAVNNIKELDDEIDFSVMSISDIRNMLYDFYDLKPIPIPEDRQRFNVGEAYAGGFNPEGFVGELDLNKSNYFMDESDYLKLGIDREFIIKGEVFGVKIPKTKDNVKK